MCASSFCIVATSRTGGMRRSATRSAVSRQAASAGSAEFFAPLTAISPSSRTPPVIENLSIPCQRFSDISARGGEQLLGALARNAALFHDNGGSYAAPGQAQARRGALVRHTGRLRDGAARDPPVFRWSA